MAGFRASLVSVARLSFTLKYLIIFLPGDIHVCYFSTCKPSNGVVPIRCNFLTCRPGTIPYVIMLYVFSHNYTALRFSH